MNKSQSIMLDLLRFYASVLVFIHHAEQVLKASILSPFASFGHDAVIFFFILSGFVIGYVSSEKEKSIYDFALARFVRIYSVAFPSLVLALIVYFVGHSFYSDSFSKNYSDVNWLSILGGSLFFLNQTSVATIAVPVNGPYWSISYEVWYYVLFGTFFYMKGIWRLVLLLIFVLVAGIKIMLLFPVWILGYLLFVLQCKLKLNNISCLFFLCVLLLIYGDIRYLNLDDVFFKYTSSFLFGNEEMANKYLGYSKRFASDYLVAVLFASVLAILLKISDFLGFWLKKYEAYIRLISSYTFSLYLFHYPLLVIFSLIFENLFIIIGSTLVNVVIIGYFTENKKTFYKINLQNFLNNNFNALRKH